MNDCAPKAAVISPAATAGPRRGARWLVLAGILLVLMGLKLSFNPGLGRNSLDGDYYFQIARHIAEGDGLLTSVSLYHQGLKQLPHPTNTSPLWPLTMGLVARVVGLERAALLLPEVLFLIDLVLLYWLANRLAATMAGAGKEILAPPAPVDVGHVAVLIFGLNPVFFRFTSLPYTEALAFLLLFAALLALDRAAGHGGFAASFLAGLLAGLGFLARAQMVGLVAAGAIAMFLVGWRSGRGVRPLAAFGAGAATAIGPWILHLATWVKPFDWRALYGSLRETPEVAAFNSRVPVESLGHLMADRLAGLRVAFSIVDADSYFASFGWSIFLVPVALVWLLMERLRRQVAAPSAGHRPASWYVLATAALLSGVLMLVPVHDAHFWFFKEWLFGFRHGLPFILLISVALAFLASRESRLARGITLLIVAGSLFLGATRVRALLGRDFIEGPVGPEAELAQWLDSRSPKPAVVTTNAQPLSVFSRSGFHWMTCRESSERTMELLLYANATHVLRYPGEERCPFLSGLDGELEVVREFSRQGLSIDVLELKRP